MGLMWRSVENAGMYHKERRHISRELFKAGSNPASSPTL